MALNTHFRILRAFSLTALLAAACFSAVGADARSSARSITLRAGTVIAVKLDQALSSNESNQGDRFIATVKVTKDKNDPYGLPVGTEIEGVVEKAQPKKDKKPGILDLSFRRLLLPDGRTYTLKGSLIGLDNKSVTRDKNGRLIANKAHRTDRLTFVGYGAGAGLLVGLLTDKKNAVRDTAIGAGLGYLYGALEKDRSKVNDVKLKAGTQLGVRLDRDLTYVSPDDDTGRR
jgi:hypothetical protein